MHFPSTNLWSAIQEMQLSAYSLQVEQGEAHEGSLLHSPVAAISLNGEIQEVQKSVDPFWNKNLIQIYQNLVTEQVAQFDSLLQFWHTLSIYKL